MLKSKNPYKYGCLVTVYRVRFARARNLAHDGEKRFIENGGKNKSMKQTDTSDKKQFLRRGRNSLLKAIFFKLKKDVVV